MEPSHSIRVKRSRVQGVRLCAVASLVATVLVFLAPTLPVSATVGPHLFYSWAQGSGVISRIANGTTTDTWASGTGASGSATGIAADDTNIYWANGRSIYRQSISGAVGATATAFVDITGWNPSGSLPPGVGAGTDNGGQRTIQYLAVDSTHIYIVARRGYDGLIVFRADKSTGLQDLSWTWSQNNGREAGGITVSSTYVFLQHGNGIGRATKAATSNAPSTADFSWVTWNVQNNISGATPVPLVNDGTHVYWGSATETVWRRNMSLASGIGAGFGEQVGLALPSSGTIQGLALNLDTGVLYASSGVGSSNTYTIYSVVPDASNNAAWTSFATFTSTSSGGLKALVATPAPAEVPTIASQPAAASKIAGESVTFGVTATTADGGTLSYQWKKDGTNISGATLPSYTKANLVAGDAGSYTVAVTNTLGASTATTTSSAAVLVVSPAAIAPTISAQPVGASKNVGETVTFSVAATTTDGGLLSYQWKKDGSDISGATSASYTKSNLVVGDAGSYTVVVTNTLGLSTTSTNSTAASLAVLTPTTTTMPVTTTTTAPATTTTTAPATTTTTVPVPQLVTAANQAQIEADPGQGAAVINGKKVEVEIVKPEPTNDPAALLESAKQIVSDLDKFIPKGAENPVKVVETEEGASLTGILSNPDNPKEEIPVPVESVTLVKAGDDAAMLVSALNQTNVPATLNAGGTIEVTRGGTLAAVAYGLPAAEEGEIVLMSTPRLLQKFTVDSSGGFKGQVPLPKNIEFGSHTVVMATKNAKVSLGIKLVRTRLQYRIKKKTAPNLFLRRAGVAKKSTAPYTVTGQGRCRANNKQIVFAAKPGRCFITVRQAAQGSKKAIFYRFTVQVVTKPTRPSPRK